MSATSKLRRRLRRMVKRDEPLTQGQEQAFLRLMKVASEPVLMMPEGSTVEWLELAGQPVPNG